MKTLTKISLILLTLSSSVTQTNFLDTCTKWWQNTDFGPYKAPVAIAGGVAGFGYLAYRDWQKEKEITELKKQIKPTEKIDISGLDEIPSIIQRLNSQSSKNMAFSKQIAELQERNKIQDKAINNFCINQGFGKMPLEDLLLLTANKMLDHDKTIHDIPGLKEKIVNLEKSMRNVGLACVSNDTDTSSILVNNMSLGNALNPEMQKRIFSAPESAKSQHAKSMHILANTLKEINRIAAIVDMKIATK
jgi:hypothetical protein